jgi:hypothetical protein
MTESTSVFARLWQSALDRRGRWAHIRIEPGLYVLLSVGMSLLPGVVAAIGAGQIYHRVALLG